MTAHALDPDAEPDWVVIAQAEGILSARHNFDLVEATTTLRTGARALGVPVARLAVTLVGAAGEQGPGADPDPDLAEEIALHEEGRRRGRAPVVLDPATEAALRRILGTAPRRSRRRA